MLRGGEEHCRLCYKPSQIQLYEPPTGKSYLVYTEDVSKTNQGGLYHRDHTAKVVHYENTECPKHCLVRLYKKYNMKCPENRPENI